MIRPKAEQVSFFHAPRVVVSQGEYMEELTSERRRRWISAISREVLTNSILENDRACSKHFVSGEPAKDWDRFNVDWFPTLCLGHSNNILVVINDYGCFRRCNFNTDTLNDFPI